mmetsp:Transcript_102352/g.208294  ORF Transcript_102352/g.208294 Transcript_102352/m.208294 type:complete len:88 (+) Transcript_102352:742-1005(+)
MDDDVGFANLNNSFFFETQNYFSCSQTLFQLLNMTGDFFGAIRTGIDTYERRGVSFEDGLRNPPRGVSFDDGLRSPLLLVDLDPLLL